MYMCVCVMVRAYDAPETLQEGKEIKRTGKKSKGKTE